MLADEVRERIAAVLKRVEREFPCARLDEAQREIEAIVEEVAIPLREQIANLEADVASLLERKA
jgi:hypothetical protein